MAVFATVLALAACGTQIEQDESITIGPTAPSEATDSAEDTDTLDDADSTAPTATPPAPAPPAPAPPGATAEQDPSGGGSTAPTTTEGTAGVADGDDATSALPDFAAPDTLLTRDPAAGTQLLVDDVRLGLQDDYDRVVLDLSGTGEVGWLVEYVDDPALDGSGTPVDLTGPAVLVVTAQGMAYPEPDDPAYDDGVLLVDGGELQTVTEVLRGVPFEGQLQVYVGLKAETPFQVFRLSGPERLVIDVQH